MKTSDKERNIIELTEALEELSIARDKVQKALNIIKKSEDEEQTPEITRIKERSEQKPRKAQNQWTNNNRIVIPNTKLKIGDRVEILNPNDDQDDQGEIVGYSVSHPYTWIWIRPRFGPRIKRIAKNLKKI